jgi:acyl-CoA synthetase (AMP-forming)/AMP-acid ligase II
VVLLMLDTIDFPAMFLGAIKAGAVPVPVNTLLKGHDYAFFLRDSRAVAVVASDALVPALELALADRPGSLRHVLVSSSPLGGPAPAFEHNASGGADRARHRHARGGGDLSR